MGGGSGGGNSTTTQKADPWEGVQPYLTQGYQQLSQLYGPDAQGPQYFPGQTLATPAGNEAIGQNMMAGQAGGMGQVAGGAQQNLQQLNANGAWGQNMGINMGTAGSQGMQQVANQNQYGGVGADQSLNSLLGYGANNTMAGAQGAFNAMGQLNLASDFNNNPAYQAALQSAIRPVTQQFNEQVMPAIQQGAQAAGQMGGSRQGIAEGIAARGYQDTVGDISANMGNAAYAQGLQALQASGQLGANMAQMGLGATGQAGQLGLGMSGLAGQMAQGQGALGSSFYGQGNTALGQGAALAPGVQGAMAAPGQMMQGIGQQQTADAQAQIDAEMARYNYGQNLPYSMIQDYLNTLNGAASLGGTQQSQQSGGGGSSRATGALGGAATGAMVGSAVPGIGTAMGAGVGALYGLFM